MLISPDGRHHTSLEISCQELSKNLRFAEIESRESSDFLFYNDFSPEIVISYYPNYQPQRFVTVG